MYWSKVIILLFLDIILCQVLLIFNKSYINNIVRVEVEKIISKRKKIQIENTYTGKYMDIYWEDYVTFKKPIETLVDMENSSFYSDFNWENESEESIF
jgi:hypothetical protein